MNPAESLDRLVSDGIVDAVVQRVKTGKEAEVFVVRKGNDYLAAKVYKERTARNFKNNVTYKEGRQVRNTRDARALAKNTKYGRNLAESDWRQTEHDALVTVAAAGVRVPKAELFYDGILLMELVLDSSGQPAPRLIECGMTSEEAYAYHRDLIGQVVKMLTCDLIHGDLSPYNVLLGWNGPTIIDLPQAVKAAHNSQSEQFLVRDVRNLTEFFARFAPGLRSRFADGYAIWRRYMRRELTPDYFPEEGEGLAAQPIDDGRRRHGRAHRPPQQRPNGQQPHQPAPAAEAHQAPAQARPPREHRPANGAAGQQHPARPAHVNGTPPAHANGTQPPHKQPGPPRQHNGRPPRPPPGRPAPAPGRPAPAPGRPAPAPGRPAPDRQGAERQGPEIVKVTRLPGAAPANGAPARSHHPQHGAQGQGKEARPSRFNQHHRRRP